MKNAVTALAAAIFASATAISPSQAQSPAQAESNKAIVQRSFDAWAAGTGTPYDLLAEGAVWTITGNSAASKTYQSREAFLGEVIRPFVARMSVGLKPVIRDIFAYRDTVIVHFDASGLAKDGKPYTNTYAWFLELRDGRIIKASAFFDSIAFNDLWSRVSPGQ